VERIAERHNVSIETARTQVLTSDQSRTRYLKKYYQSRWDDPGLYDLMVNTEHLGAENAAWVICKALEQRERAV
jgi:cytidylate kinase